MVDRMRKKLEKKTFFMDSKGLVGRHKTQQTILAGTGIVHKDQKVVAYTNAGNKFDIHFDLIKVGTHHPSTTLNLDEFEHITKIDIVTVVE